MTDAARVLLDRLQRDPTETDRAALADARAEIDALTETCAALAAAGRGVDAGALTRARIASSNTLSCTSKILRPDATERLRAQEAWSKANDLVVRFVSDDVPVSLHGVQRVHAAVVGIAEPAGWRTRPMFLDGRACPDPDDVPALLAPMVSSVQARTRADGVLFGAGLLYQWLVSVHPLGDANGRTARLVTDWYLGLHGEMPLSYASFIDGFVAISSEDEEGEARTIRHGAEAVARGVLHTLGLLVGGRRP